MNGYLTEGLKLAGFRILGAIDNDDLSVETYRVNHPEVHVWHKDIRKLAASDILTEFKLASGDLGLLAGCPPCQGFSAHRTRNGNRRIRDRRNTLIDQFTRLVDELRPKTVMMENVPGLATNRRFADFRSALRRLGYTVNWDILNARHYGIPQNRRRLILMASLLGPVEFATPDSTELTVRDAIAGLPRAGRSDDPLHDLPEQRSAEVKELIRLVPKNGGSRLDLPKRLHLACHKRFDGYKDVYGRMAWDKHAPTITGGCCNPSKGRFLHPMANRCITLREAALLQGFRGDYYFSLRNGKFPAAGMIGNALPPGFVRSHGEQLYHHLAQFA